MIQRPRGTKDIYGIDENIYRFIFETFESVAKSFNLKKITTPTFESVELFKKTTGQTTDIVTKELYKFEDLSGRELALKPEGTAPIARAILENKLYLDKQFNKLYYIDSMYRYEKPQKGRMRQFYQIGIELTNELNNISIIESIMIAISFLKKLDITSYTLHINNLGNNEERQTYIEKLKDYFYKHKEQLSISSQNKIETNVLRILDDKVDSQLEVVKNAPKINKFISDKTNQEFEQLLKMLDQLQINYIIDYSLVRGLDYYSNVVYEFISDSPFLGAKSTLIGGGCYLDLAKNSSIKIDGVGFGCGVERLFEILKNQQKSLQHNSVDVYFVIENEEQYKLTLPIIYELRDMNFLVEFNYSPRKFKKVFSDAQSLSSKIIIFQELNQQNQLKQWTIKINGINEIIDINNVSKKVKDILK